MPQSPVCVSLLGHGVIGAGVAELLTAQKDLLRQRCGIDFELRHVLEREPGRMAGTNLPFTQDPAAALEDPAVSIVIELIGGVEPAATFVARAIRAGKHIVTANKAMIAAKGPELFALARQHNVAIGFEASCGGGIPIIEALTRGLLANRIEALVGIVNGTCNVILTRMTRNGWTYDEALKEAQKLGFAEANPTLDVSGRDAAQKLSILATLAFGALVREQDIFLEGIDKLDPADVRAAGELGYIIKLLAIGQRVGDALCLRVHPTLVHKDDVLAEVSGPFNAISVWGHALGHASFYGRGAGRKPTASAVVADVISMASGITPLSFNTARVYPDLVGPARIVPIDQLESRYYLRLVAKDEPGVMARVAAVLGAEGISLSAIRQRETSRDQYVDVVITTHGAREGAMRAALKQIDALDAIRPPTACLRIIDSPEEYAQG